MGRVWLCKLWLKDGFLSHATHAYPPHGEAVHPNLSGSLPGNWVTGTGGPATNHPLTSPQRHAAVTASRFIALLRQKGKANLPF